MKKTILKLKTFGKIKNKYLYNKFFDNRFNSVLMDYCEHIKYDLISILFFQN